MNQNGIFVPSLKIGFVLALVNTLYDALKIWSESPSVSELSSLGATGENALTVYRLSMLTGAAIPNFILWFVIALVIMFVLRQLKKA